MTVVTAERGTDGRESAGAHRLGDHPDADGRWSCWDCGEAADTRSGLVARDDCRGSTWWCSMCRRRRHAPDYECECSLSGLQYARCGICGQWELEPESAENGKPICRGCESSSFNVGVALDAMLAAARASLLPFQGHAERYAALARRFADVLPEATDHQSVARDYAAAFESAAEALGGLAQMHNAVERVRIQSRERAS